MGDIDLDKAQEFMDNAMERNKEAVSMLTETSDKYNPNIKSLKKDAERRSGRLMFWGLTGCFLIYITVFTTIIHWVYSLITGR